MTMQVTDSNIEEFLKWNNWFDQIFKPNLDQRWATMKVALNLLRQMDRPVNILETGCVRQELDLGGGMSTLLFGEFVSRYGGHITTIDNNPENMEVCKKVTKDFADQIDYIIGDSLEELEKLSLRGDYKADLLYLDSMDCPIDGSSAFHSQGHLLKELKLAKPMLRYDSIVLLDDSGFENGGKVGLAVPVLLDWGWTCLMIHQQALFIRK